MCCGFTVNVVLSNMLYMEMQHLLNLLKKQQTLIMKESLLLLIYVKPFLFLSQTNVGPILLSVNPYHEVGNALTLTSTRAAVQSPHLLRVVHEAVRQQSETGYPQAIILSGNTTIPNLVVSPIVILLIFLLPTCLIFNKMSKRLWMDCFVSHGVILVSHGNLDTWKNCFLSLWNIYTTQDLTLTNQHEFYVSWVTHTWRVWRTESTVLITKQTNGERVFPLHIVST